MQNNVVKYKKNNLIKCINLMLCVAGCASLFMSWHSYRRHQQNLADDTHIDYKITFVIGCGLIGVSVLCGISELIARTCFDYSLFCAKEISEDDLTVAPYGILNSTTLST